MGGHGELWKLVDFSMVSRGISQTGCSIWQNFPQKTGQWALVVTPVMMMILEDIEADNVKIAGYVVIDTFRCCLVAFCSEKVRAKHQGRS